MKNRLRVITINVNGLRSAAKKGLFSWLKKQKADVICLQEVRADQTVVESAEFCLDGYYAYFHYAQKKGYSGVGIYSRYQPLEVITGLGFDVADQEGRYIAINLGATWVASLYLPSGTSSEERQKVKYDFLDLYEQHLIQIKNKSQEYIICGDWNIAHKKIDLKNWQSNQKNSGFLPAERAWLDKLFNEIGFVDAFRLIDSSPEQYTWWSNRTRAFEKNVGWRIDYQIITPQLASKVKAATIYKAERFSDHAPLIMDYEINLN